MARRLRPLTVRLLRWLPGPRLAWIAAWALVPWLNAAGNVLLDTRTAIWEESRALALTNYAALSVGVALTLWGSDRITRRLEELGGTTSRAFGPVEQAPFRGMNSLSIPLAGAAATALVFAAVAFARDGWDSAALRGATWFVLGVAFWTFLVVYLSLQLGLHRLGGAHLAADAVRVDPGLGLRPLGGVAFMGFWMLLASIVPVLLTGLPDVAGAVIGTAVVAGGVAAFFLSLFRLHRGMVEVKAGELAVARDLYAQAYEPVRTAPDLDTLERQRALLGAADALERRAAGIHEWPLDEGTFARVLTITTSVIAMIIGRLILEPLGF
jgi:hypothetical protein